MPSLDPCTEGCSQDTVQNRPPGATDDACNTSLLGYFCLGSMWTYDPTLGGADTATNGVCPRAWIKTGDSCNVNEWLELSVANIQTAVVPPVDTVDCCPPGTLWCIPAGTNGSTKSETYISTDGGCGVCTWCKICGYFVDAISLGATIAIIPEGIDYNIPYNNVALNESGLATIALPRTITEGGCYSVEVSVFVDYFGPDAVNISMDVFDVINGGHGVTIASSNGFSIVGMSTAPFLASITRQIVGSLTRCYTVGDTVQMGMNITTTTGGGTYTIRSAGWVMRKVPD